MRRIAMITGSRGEYGYIRPVIREIEKHGDLDYNVIVTNQHLLSDFGSSVEEIESDRFKISDRIYMAFDGYTPASMSKSLGVCLMSLTDSLVRLRPDILLLAGDRGEQLMGAITAAHMNIPIAHIQAGELSGNIDGMTRHAITRFAHLHFASCENAVNRLKKMGEQEFRIHLTGAPQLDELVKKEFTAPKEISQKFKLDLTKPLVLFVQHSVTEEFERTENHIRETLEAIGPLGLQTLIVFPNSDAGSADARRVLERYHLPHIQLHRNLARRDYLGLMNVAKVMVGNSSSGLIEAPCFKLPAVNVGDRQRGRERGCNVIDVPNEHLKIRKSVEKALSKEFIQFLKKKGDNPYHGDGKVAERIVRLLRKTALSEDLLKKQIAY